VWNQQISVLRAKPEPRSGVGGAKYRNLLIPHLNTSIRGNPHFKWWNLDACLGQHAHGGFGGPNSLKHWPQGPFICPILRGILRFKLGLSGMLCVPIIPGA